MQRPIINAILWAAAIGTFASFASPATAQDNDAAIAELQHRLHVQAEQIHDLQQRLDGGDPARQDRSPFGVFPDASDASCMPGDIVRLPLTTEEEFHPSCVASGAEKAFHTLNFYADYDNGFRVRPFAPSKHPFELKVNGWIQFRYHGFARDVSSWTDNAGVTRPVRNRSALDIERGRLVLSGYAVDERLTYFLQLDGDTDGGHTVDFFDYWWGWQASDAFRLEVGKRKVPASRQWLLTARSTRLIDRPMANDFFRPDRTIGIFGVGTFGDTGHYEVMLGNSYRSANLPNSSVDDQFTLAATQYLDSFGPYGSQVVDFDGSRELLLRVGHSFVFAPQASDQLGMPLDEANFVRLSDGTRLTQTGALAAGATVSEYDIFFYGVDAAFKWRGWSLNTEAFLRWIEDIAADAPIPNSGLEQFGFYVEGGCFLIPQTLDVNLRYSQVSGEYGDASEYAAGCNWYPMAKPQLKLSFDITSLDGSPLRNTASDILAGDDGVLFRTQFQSEF